MSDVQQRVEAFFSQYDTANAAGDFEAIGRLYDTTFLFGLPQGTRTVNAADFVALVSKRRQAFRAQGLSETRLKSVEAVALDGHYVQAKVAYDMRVNGVDRVTRATYILLDDTQQLRIVFQIDHQDLAEELAAEGITRIRESSDARRVLE